MSFVGLDNLDNCIDPDAIVVDVFKCDKDCNGWRRFYCMPLFNGTIRINKFCPMYAEKLVEKMNMTTPRMPRIYKPSDLKQMNPEIELRKCIKCGGEPVLYMDFDGVSICEIRCRNCGIAIKLSDSRIDRPDARGYRQWNALNLPSDEKFTPKEEPHWIFKYPCCGNCRLNNKCESFREMDGSQMYESICGDYL